MVSIERQKTLAFCINLEGSFNLTVDKQNLVKAVKLTSGFNIGNSYTNYR